MKPEMTVNAEFERAGGGRGGGGVNLKLYSCPSKYSNQQCTGEKRNHVLDENVVWCESIFPCAEARSRRVEVRFIFDPKPQR
jgi:hypothetical protein